MCEGLCNATCTVQIRSNLHRTAEDHQVGDCEAKVASPRANTGGPPYHAIFKSLAYNDYDAPFQVLETTTWAKRNSESLCQTPPLSEDTAKLAHLGTFANYDVGSQRKCEHRDHAPSGRTCRRSYNCEDQQCDTDPFSEAATDASSSSHSSRTDELYMPTGTSSCSKEIDLNEVRPAAQYFDI